MLRQRPSDIRAALLHKRFVDTILGREPILVAGALGALTTEFIAAALDSDQKMCAVELDRRRR